MHFLPVDDETVLALALCDIQTFVRFLEQLVVISSVKGRRNSSNGKRDTTCVPYFSYFPLYSPLDLCEYAPHLDLAEVLGVKEEFIASETSGLTMLP